MAEGASDSPDPRGAESAGISRHEGANEVQLNREATCTSSALVPSVNGATPIARLSRSGGGGSPSSNQLEVTSSPTEEGDVKPKSHTHQPVGRRKGIRNKREGFECPCEYCNPGDRRAKPKRQERPQEEPAMGEPGIDLPNQAVYEKEEEPPKQNYNYVVPQAQTDITILESKNGVTVDSEQPLVDVPQKVLVQRVVDYESVQKSSLLWRIDQVAEKVRAGRKEEMITIYSQTFYTTSHGYRMMAATCLYGTGINRGKFLPIFFFLCKGKFDNLLPWPMRANFTVKLMDQNPEQDQRKDITVTFSPDPDHEGLRKALQQPLKERNNYFGVAKFAPLKVLSPHKYHYVRDNVMFLQVFVEKDEMPII